MTKRILISGGTGLVGRKLSETLTAQGHEVRILTRSPKGRKNHYLWDTEAGDVDLDAFQGIDAVVHLAGAGVADHRWTNSYKSIMEKSRIDTAILLKESMIKADVHPEHFISASASGYYGDKGDTLLDESTKPGDDYLAQLCVKWEDAANKAGHQAQNTSILRFGIVLDKEGGFYGRVAPIVKWYLGAALGSGKQYIPWVHVDDVVGPIESIINGKVSSGVYNISAPEPVTNKAMMKAIAKAEGAKILLPNVPVFALHILFGEMKFALLQSNRLSCQKLIDSGYDFKFTDLDEALAEISSQ